jgi:general secretion pathway protein L
MSDLFVLRLLPEGSAEWLSVESGGLPLGPLERGSVAEAGARAAGRRSVVLVPANEVALALAQVPAKSGQRLQALVPYALEEQLASDVDSLHFATGRPVGSQVPTVAIERDRLKGWLATLAGAGIHPEAIYPDALALPDNPGHIVAACDGERLLIRRPRLLPLALEARPMATALAVAGLPSATPGELEDLIVYASPADWQRHGPSFEALRERLATLNVQLQPEGLTPLLAAGAVRGTLISLMQGEYAPRGGLGNEWRRWQLAAALAGACLLVHLAAQGVNYARLRSEERNVDRELIAAAQKALPEATTPIAAAAVRSAIEARLRGAQSAGHSGLLGTLSGVARAFGQAPNTQLRSVSFHNGVTDLTVDAPDIGTLDRFQQALNAAGWPAAMQGANQHENRFQGHVTVRGAG